MEQLTIKELAVYLPYNLQCVCYTDYNGGTNTIQEITGIGESYVTYRNTSYQCVDVNFTQIKPILRNLSDLTKEIEVNGEKFVPIERLRSKFIVIDGSHRHFDYPFILDGKLCGVLSLPYWVITELLSWHFDVFGLIDKGLAIDLNTL